MASAVRISLQVALGLVKPFPLRTLTPFSPLIMAFCGNPTGNHSRQGPSRPDAAVDLVGQLRHRGPVVTQRTDGARWPEDRLPQTSQRDAAPRGCHGAHLGWARLPSVVSPPPIIFTRSSASPSSSARLLSRRSPSPLRSSDHQLRAIAHFACFVGSPTVQNQTPHPSRSHGPQGSPALAV
jgi:hypothetical protein